MSISVLFSIPRHPLSLIILCLAMLLGTADADIRINEFVANNSSGLVDEDGDYSDWIEIYNTGPDEVDLTGWSLTDNAEKTNKRAFTNTNLPSASYLTHKGESPFPLKDDGSAPDEVAGDGYYTGKISANTLFGKRYRVGEMLRWAFLARDSDGHEARLQHRFGKIRQPRPPMEGYPLGNVPRLGQISLTVRDAEESLAFYRDSLGMRMLSRQDVPAHGFTLTFLAFTDEQPPNPSLNAVENREWLWQRSYTTLELRAYAASTPRVPHSPESQLGFRGIRIAGPEGERQQLCDPDGVLVNITSDCSGEDAN